MKDKTILSADDLFFSREAADYLGISVQRLNMLTKEGKIHPLKKNSSGTVYHISELLRRKEELSVFEENDAVIDGNGLTDFRIDTAVKREALNFSTMMNILGISEKKLSPQFDELSLSCDITCPIVESLDAWSSFFHADRDRLEKCYMDNLAKFSMLHPDDEIIRIGSPEYPEMLAETKEAPRFLYLRGDRSLLLDNRTVALVGSREASDEAKRNTERVASVLGKNGIIIVSGLAKGIDVTAHRTALDYGYRTIAVIGTNLNQYYPNENKGVQLEIEKKGLVVSQFSPAMKTERYFFPMRNAVMSGISRATVIMEAGETSGALVQARFALKQGRLVLIPQNAFTNPLIKWPKEYLRKGALPVRTPREIIEKLSEQDLYRSGSLEEQMDLFGFDTDYITVAEEVRAYSADKSR